MVNKEKFARYLLTIRSQKGKLRGLVVVSGRISVPPVMIKLARGKILKELATQTRFEASTQTEAPDSSAVTFVARIRLFRQIAISNGRAVFLIKAGISHAF